jgi:MOSC domain-containing protein YiiM
MIYGGSTRPSPNASAPSTPVGQAVDVQSYEIVSVNVAEPSVLLHHFSGDVISAIDKKPVTTSSLHLSTLNLEGDCQADTRLTPAGGQVHGGSDQAVYAFPVEHFSRIGEIVGSDIHPGFMGENVTLRGALEADVCIGDTWQWGDAVVQVTAPRGPCFKLGIRIGRQAARTIIREEGLVGWYLRVLTPGVVGTAGTIALIERHPAGVTVEVAHRALQDRDAVYPDLAGLEVMSTNLRAALMRRGRDMTGGVPEQDAPVA